MTFQPLNDCLKSGDLLSDNSGVIYISESLESRHLG
jgi:hypothetical protein